jgi:hypothetical protein
MKVFLVSVVAAVVIALGAAVLLDTRLQRESADAFATSGVRL